MDARRPEIRQQAARLLEQVSGIAPADETPTAESSTGQAEAAARWKAWAATDAAAHPRPLGLKRLSCYATKAASFNGKSSITANGVEIDTARAWSLAFWIYAKDTSTAIPVAVCISTGSCGSDPQLNFNASTRGLFVVGACGTANYVKIGPAADFTGRWKHVVIVSDGRTTRAYVNGSETGSGPIAWPASTQQKLTLAANECRQRTTSFSTADCRKCICTTSP